VDTELLTEANIRTLTSGGAGAEPILAEKWSYFKTILIA
jgi:hypothetical protein